MLSLVLLPICRKQLSKVHLSSSLSYCWLKREGAKFVRNSTSVILLRRHRNQTAKPFRWVFNLMTPDHAHPAITHTLFWMPVIDANNQSRVIQIHSGVNNQCSGSGRAPGSTEQTMASEVFHRLSVLQSLHMPSKGNHIISSPIVFLISCHVRSC